MYKSFRMKSSWTKHLPWTSMDSNETLSTSLTANQMDLQVPLEPTPTRLASRPSVHPSIARRMHSTPSDAPRLDSHPTPRLGSLGWEPHSWRPSGMEPWIFSQATAGSSKGSQGSSTIARSISIRWMSWDPNEHAEGAMWYGPIWSLIKKNGFGGEK